MLRSLSSLRPLSYTPSSVGLALRSAAWASRRSAPRAPCAAVLVHGILHYQASIRYRNRYLPHPRTGEGSRLSHAFRRHKAVGFSGIFFALRAMPSKPTPLLPPPLATAACIRASGCIPSGIPRSTYVGCLPLNRYLFQPLTRHKSHYFKAAAPPGNRYRLRRCYCVKRRAHGVLT